MWQQSRVMISKDMIAFSNPGDDTILDQIFLKEVELCQDMSKFNVGVDGAKFAEAILIKTSLFGHNSGRTYYLQAVSKEDCTLLESQICRLARAAKRRERSVSTLSMIRLLARDVFESRNFQGFTAFLILAV